MGRLGVAGACAIRTLPQGLIIFRQSGRRPDLYRHTKQHRRDPDAEGCQWQYSGHRQPVWWQLAGGQRRHTRHHLVKSLESNRVFYLFSVFFLAYEMCIMRNFDNFEFICEISLQDIKNSIPKSNKQRILSSNIS